MTDIMVPYKACYLAFAIQTAKGSAASTPTVAYPLPEAGAGLDPMLNLSFFHWADRNYGVAHYMSEGKWNEGTITVPVIPGYTLADDDDQVIYKALFGRQASAYYYDGYWMTVWRVLGSMLVERFSDVRITEATLNLEAQAVATLELSCTGIAAATEPADPDETVVTTDPYTFAGASFEVSYGGAAEAAEDYLRSVTMNFNNHCLAPADMITLRGSYYPIDLPMVEKTEVSGSMHRIMANDSLYDDFKAGQEGSMTCELVSGATTCTIEVPRMVYSENPLAVGTEDVVREDSVSWQGLASVDAATDAITVTEA